MLAIFQNLFTIFAFVFLPAVLKIVHFNRVVYKLYSPAKGLNPSEVKISISVSLLIRKTINEVKEQKKEKLVLINETFRAVTGSN